MNKKRYWLRGAVVGLILGLVIIIPQFIPNHPSEQTNLHFVDTSSSPSVLQFLVQISSKIIDISVLPWSYIIPIPLFEPFGFLPIIYLILDGIILGWLYGKIKKPTAV